MSQYYMKWDEYSNHLSSVFLNLRSKEDLVDVTLCAEGRKIRGHKILLSAFSSYFRDIFQENPTPHPVIIFKNVKYEVLLSIVDFIYQGEVSMLEIDLTSFFETAEMLCVRGIDDKKAHKHQHVDHSSVLTTNLQNVKEEPPEDLNNSDNDEDQLNFEPEKQIQQAINPFNSSISRISGSQYDENNHVSTNFENASFCVVEILQPTANVFITAPEHWITDSEKILLWPRQDGFKLRQTYIKPDPEWRKLPINRVFLKNIPNFHIALIKEKTIGDLIKSDLGNLIISPSLTSSSIITRTRKIKNPQNFLEQNMIIENDNIVAPNPSPPNTSQPSKSQFSKLMSLNEKQSSTISTMTLTSEDSDDYSLLVESPDISDSDYKTPHQSLITAYGLTNNQDIVTPTSVTQNTVDTIKTHIDSKMKAFNSEIRSMISRIASTPAEQSYSSPFESSSPYSRINVTPPSRDLMHRLPLRTIDEMKVMENDLKTDPEVISAVISHLSILRGNTVTSTLKRIMQTMMAESLFSKMTLRGTAEKESFSKYPYMIDTILTSARNINSTIDIGVLETFLKHYFKNSNKRKAPYDS